MRALVVINALGEGGTETSTAELLSPLREHGIESSVALLRSRGTEGVEQDVRDNGFPVEVLPSGLHRQVRALRRVIGDLGPDLVHSALFEANLACRLARTRRVPLLTSLVNLSYAPERIAVAGPARHKLRVTQVLDALTGPLTSHFHAVSEAVAADAAKRLRIAPSRISVVPRGRPDLRARTPAGSGATVRDGLGIAPDDLVVVNVARQEPQKDHLTLLAALEPLLRDRPDVHLVLAGREGTASTAIHDRLATMADTDRVHLLGHRGDVGAVLDAGDLFVLPTRYEGMPGAVIEAMAMGLPIVASAIAPVREVLGPADLPRAGDAAGFTAAIRGVLDDAGRRRASGAANRSRFEERFTIERSTAGMADLYRHVAG